MTDADNVRGAVENALDVLPTHLDHDLGTQAYRDWSKLQRLLREALVVARRLK